MMQISLFRYSVLFFILPWTLNLSTTPWPCFSYQQKVKISGRLVNDIPKKIVNDLILNLNVRETFVYVINRALNPSSYSEYLAPVILCVYHSSIFQWLLVEQFLRIEYKSKKISPLYFDASSLVLNFCLASTSNALYNRFKSILRLN